MKHFFHLLIVLCLFGTSTTYAQDTQSQNVKQLIMQLNQAVDAGNHALALDLTQKIRASIKDSYCEDVSDNLVPASIQGYNLSSNPSHLVNQAPNKSEMTLQRVYSKTEGGDSTAFTLLITSSPKHQGSLAQMCAKNDAYTDGNYRIAPMKIKGYRSVLIKDQQLHFKSIAIIAGAAVVRFDFPPDMTNEEAKGIVQAFNLNSIVQKFGN